MCAVRKTGSEVSDKKLKSLGWCMSLNGKRCSFHVGDLRYWLNGTGDYGRSRVSSITLSLVNVIHFEVEISDISSSIGNSARA
jgi:hypothetical protein